MRALATMALLAAVSIGCSAVSSNGLSNGGIPIRHDAGSGTTGGAPPGSPCASGGVCGSGICGVTGTGNCCTRACDLGDETCGAIGCDDAGACMYPASGLDCGLSTCSNNTQAQPQCDGHGSCSAESLMPCATGISCDDAGAACNSKCSSSAPCLSGYGCNDGFCVKPVQFGPCTAKADCLSGICGVNGTGNCCNTKCVQGAPCGATDCDVNTGDCNYAANTVACGQASCDGGLFQTPACDGLGSCAGSLSAECLPFTCNANGCLLTCSSKADCVAGYCDLPSSTCCGLASGAQMFVDGAAGDDTQVCCGSKSSPCLTLTHAMQLVDEAQAQNVVITATYNGSASGVWAPPAEIYPIVLGWGVELSAYGIAFFDGDSNRALFEIGPVSANDSVGSASIVGGAVGVSAQPPTDKSTILVEPKGTLYLAGTLVYSSVGNKTTAIEVSAGGALVLGQDRAGDQTGTVFIGNNSPIPATEGYNGIVCDSANGLGCTISDAQVGGVTGSVVIGAQANHDLDAEDFATINLSFEPQIGIRATGAGRANCMSFEDGSASNDAAILVHGKATVTISNGAVQCIGGTAIALEASANGVPSLVLADMTIEDSAVGLHAFAGTATITDSVIEYNTIGVVQDTDGTNVASVDLNFGSNGGNTVACNTSGDGGMIGASVINRTSQVLEAQQVDWDTSGPDLFSCDLNLMNCSCDTTCTDAPGADGMDAVMESSGSIDTTGNGSAAACVN